MQLQALEQFHISSVSSDTIKPGQEFVVSESLGNELIKKHPGMFIKVSEKSKPLPNNKSEAPPKNKLEPPAKNNDEWPPDYAAMKPAALKKLAADRGVEIGDAKNAGDLIAALQLNDEAAKKAD